MTTEAPSLDAVVQAWILTMSTEVDPIIREENFWAFEYIASLENDKNSVDFLWAFILEVLNRNVSEKLLYTLAAGPLEELLCFHGESVIDRVEASANSDTKFANLLAGVWRSDMEQHVWERVGRALSDRPCLGA
ncbi:MAG: hypothetical protein J0H83_05665 [Candidatus Melainabacteria bacterium]|nr:hypothetical protein [Candidatus Melainabacteria bacterium]